MRTEREPNRYEPLNDTHRRVAEDEEKRRLAEREQLRSASEQPEPEPFRPGTELRPHRPEAEPEHDPDSPEARIAAWRPWEPEAETNSPEARLAAKEQELQEQVRLGRINPSEMIHQLRQFDDELRIEIEHGGTSAQRDNLSGGQSELSAKAELENPQAPERPEDLRDQPTDQSRYDPSQHTPETRIEREAEAAEYEIVGRGEMSDARAARLERLRGIDHDIERENRENEGQAPDLGHDSGDRSR